MTETSAEDGQRPLTPAATRILETAGDLFYRRGIHAVGVDTIAAESGVTKRTLYDRFGSKDALVEAYLRRRDSCWRRDVTAALAATADADPVQRTLVPFDVLREWLAPPSRGCGFINAFAELSEPSHPARQVITDDKQWLRALFNQLLADAGVADPATLAVQLLSLHDGAVVTQTVADEPSAVACARAAAETLVAQRLSKG